MCMFFAVYVVVSHVFELQNSKTINNEERGNNSTNTVDTEKEIIIFRNELR